MRIALAVAGIALCVLGANQMLAAEQQTSAALHALDYARTQQQSDGGFASGFGPGSDTGATLDAVFAFASTGIDPKTVTKDGKSPADYLGAQAGAYSASPGGAAKLVLGIATMDLDATAFGGIDALYAIEANYDPVSGAYGTDGFAPSLFILAEASLGRPVPAAAVGHVSSLQGPDGGWEFCCAFGADTNTTSLAVRALVAAGVSPADSRVVDALAFLAAHQPADGGIEYQVGFGSDANSTAFAIQALVAAGQNIDAGGPWDAGGGATPLIALLAYQNTATGALQYFGEDSPLATYQGVPGLMLSAYPEQQQSFTPTPTHTVTIQATSTAVTSPTASATSSTTPVHTATAVATSTAIAAAANPATSTPTPTPTPGGGASSVSSVLGSSTIALPDTGYGRSRGNDTAGLTLIVAGTTLVAAGAAARRRVR